MKKYTYFVGIDVSKNSLDFAVLHGNEFLFHQVIANDILAIKELITELKTVTGFTMTKAVFGLEQTGIYSGHVLKYLKKLKANIVLENALHIRNSLGTIRGKYDKIDAIRIAQYLFRNKENIKLWQPRRSPLQQLAHLSTLRNRLISLQSTLNVPLKEDSMFIDKKIISQSKLLCQNSSMAVSSDLNSINEKILEIINQDERIKRLHEIVTSVPGVGTVTALQIILTTNEFLNISDPKKFACYAGVAPFKRSSGLLEGKAKVSLVANKKVKALLQVCALAAVRSVPDIKAYFERKTKTDGKPKMAVYNAVRNKLILRVFACVNQNRCYEKDYRREIVT